MAENNQAFVLVFFVEAFGPARKYCRGADLPKRAPTGSVIFTPTSHEHMPIDCHQRLVRH